MMKTCQQHFPELARTVAVLTCPLCARSSFRRVTGLCFPFIRTLEQSKETLEHGAVDGGTTCRNAAIHQLPNLRRASKSSESRQSNRAAECALNTQHV